MASDPDYKNAIISARIRNDDVTGSSIELFVSDNGKKAKYIIDKGLFLGANEQTRNFTEETYDDVDAVFLTHAHVDHCGQIPQMCKNGFKGPIYMSRQTALISQALIQDEFYVLKQNGIKITKEDERSFRRMINQTKTVGLNDNIQLYNARFNMLGNSHVLGSNMVYMRTIYSKNNMHVLVTGDYRDDHPFIKKNSISRFIKNNPVDVMFMESTYGGRADHPSFDYATMKLQEAIIETISNGGNALIPVFSFDRTQVILYALQQIQLYNPEFRNIPIYADGKLMQYITHLYNQNKDQFRCKQNNIMPMNLTNVVGGSQRTSVYRNNPRFKVPKIILATSGQMHSGAIVPYISNMIENSKDSIISVGYVGHKIGRNILDMPEGSVIEYAGRQKTIKCKRYQIDGFSAHGDMKQLNDLVEKVKKYNPNLKVVLYHGSADAKGKLKQYIVDKGTIDEDRIYIPSSQDRILINKCTVRTERLIKSKSEENDS